MRKLDYQADTDEAPRHMRALHPRFSVRGITGTQLSGGMITGYERNAQLTGLNWVREAEDMLRTDPVVRRSWHMLRQTLLSATWRWESAMDGNPICEELARFANEAWGLDGYAGQMSQSWEEQLSYLLEFVPLGYRYAEEVYKVGPDAEGKIKVWLEQYADREPSAHLRWLSRDNQQLDGVLQHVVGVGKVPEPIPSNKLLLLTLNRTGSNFEGSGMLRPVWWWWRTKQKVSNLMCVGVDRWAVPTPRVKVDRSVAEMQGLTDSDINAMIDDAEAQAQAFLSAEQSYLIDNPVVSLDPSHLPRLVHTGLDTDDLAESLAMLPQLVTAGLLTPDNELERAIRERLGAGDLPEEAQRSALERTVSAASGGGGVAALAEAAMRRRRQDG
jgi:hypothetical protein